MSSKRNPATGIGWFRWLLGWFATPLVNRLHDRGTSLVNSDQPERAERTLRFARHLDPYRLSLIGQHAIALSDCGEYELAESLFEWMTKQTPEDPRTWANLGESISRQGRCTDALAMFEKAESLGLQGLFPNYYTLGERMLHEGLHAEACQVYRRAVELEPEDGKVWTNYSYALLKTNQSAHAEQAARRAVEIIPDDDFSWCNLGSALEELGKLEEALVAYDKSVEVNPEHEVDCTLGAELRARLSRDN